MKMIKCKACGADIASNAKSCPNCGAKNKKPIYKRVWFWALIFIIIIAAVSAIGGDDSPNTTTEPVKDNNVKTEIEYTAYSVDEMMDDLKNNALTASDKYSGKYVEITGTLDVIDSNGDYIAVLPEHDEWAIIGVHCTIKNDKQLDKVKEMSIGEKITVKGKITDVGEVLGYYLSIDEIM